jgi:hypothetical protein
MGITWQGIFARFFVAVVLAFATYLVLVALCGVLATGISWSHIRRRISGQVDVDEIDEE